MKHPIPIALRETLDSIVSPEVRDSLLENALREAREPELPTDPAAFRNFASGPLRRALIKGLGPELAETLVEELEHVVDLLERHSAKQTSGRRASISGQLRAVTPPSRRSTRPPPAPRAPSAVPPPRRVLSPRPGTLRSTMHGMGTPPPWSGPITKPPQAFGRMRSNPAPSGPSPRRADITPSSSPVDSFPPAPTDSMPPIPDAIEAGLAAQTGRSLPFVLVVSRDVNMMRRLTSWLDPHAALFRVRNVYSLLHAMEDTAHARSVILLDCKAPSIRATALAALADEMPKNVQVVLWGASPELQRTLLVISERTADWIVCKSETRPKEIAERCFSVVS